MKAIIMAGGKGSRLYPYTALLPKPLMPLGEMPILEVLLTRLRNAGVTDVIIAVNHLRHLIEAFFGDGSRMGLKIRYSLEDKPLGTAGPMGTVLDDLGDDFVLTNGDLLTTLDVAAMVKAHRATRADATIGVYKREVKIDFGLVDLDAEMRMVGYREKPSYEHLVSMGLYVLKAAAVRRFTAPDTYLDMPNLLQQMVSAGHNVRGFKDDCFWLDIGRPEDFALAQQMVEKDPHVFLGTTAGVGQGPKT